jgi:hypothetical protein
MLTGPASLVVAEAEQTTDGRAFNPDGSLASATAPFDWARPSIPRPDLSRVRRCRRGILEFEHGLVEVTPIPVVARSVGPDNRVSGQAEVPGGVGRVPYTVLVWR